MTARRVLRSVAKFLLVPAEGSVLVRHAGSLTARLKERHRVRRRGVVCVEPRTASADETTTNDRGGGDRGGDENAADDEARRRRGVGPRLRRPHGGL